MTKPTKPTVPPAPSRTDPGAEFATKADTFAAFQAPFANYLDATATYVDGRAAAALAAALLGTLPPLTGRALNMTRVNAGATALEFRTPAQVLTDLGVTAAGRALVDDADAAAQLATLGAQAADATLTSLSGLSLVEGDILYATGADTLVRLPKGTAGQVLAMNPGATAPQWVAGPIGVGQTWQNVAASRAWNTNYQNTSGKPIMVQVRATSVSTTMTLQVGETTGSYVTVASDDQFNLLTAIVPPNHFYRADGSGTFVWMELR